MHVQGRVVSRLAAGTMSAGTHDLRWRGGEKPGIYFARLQGEGWTMTRTIVRIR